MIATFTLSFNAAGAERQRNWQTGKVVDSQRSRYFYGTVDNANKSAQANRNHGDTTSSQTVYRIYETFLIEGETQAYLAQEGLRFKYSKAANLTMNGPVKFAAKKRKLFVVGEDGRQREMEIIKKMTKVRDQAKP